MSTVLQWESILYCGNLPGFGRLSESQIKGRSQAVIGHFTVERKILHEALMLLFFSVVIILSAAFLHNISEGGLVPHTQSHELSTLVTIGFNVT